MTWDSSDESNTSITDPVSVVAPPTGVRGTSATLTPQLLEDWFRL